ncbi:hypothetical protein QBC38DRAFT_450254 [Podospora fimiseda]|uniref:Secreted protein n=1 Tax=Podospora fimiseda TaxID=252190 RepID=A0AAN7H8P4_9PEZI|nr:hypothetical protein QBC38DRAFT_450254 [Podospora fimiseda]
MKLFTTLSAVILPFLLNPVDASPAMRGDEIPGYKTVELSWEVATTPGGPTMILNGTVQQVRAQLLQLNPNYDNDFAELTAASKAAAAMRRSKGVSKDVDPSHRLCDIWGRWDSATKKRILEGIDYLHHINGQPHQGPGPGNCGRVSCSFDSAIIWCNDNPTTKYLDNFNLIADDALNIITECPEIDTEVLGVRTINGQLFHDDGWNTIVKGAKC